MKKIFSLLLYIVCSSYCFAQDGALNTAYVPQSPFTTVYAMVIDSGGNTFVAGSNSGTGIAMDIVKIKPDGTIDTYFNCTYFDNFVNPNLIVVKNMCLQDGKLLVCGQLRDIPFYELAAVRFNINGSLDTTFNVSLPDNFTADDIVIQPVTNKILIGGQGGIASGSNYTNYFFRLLSDGSTDTTFNTGGSFFSSAAYISDILTLSNGDMYVCGGFDTYNGAARKNIVKLNADGSLNALTFTPINAWYKRMALQSTGKLVVIGQFYDSAYPGLSTIARFNTTGTLDTSFTPPSPSTPPYTFNDLKIQSNDKIVIGGEFTMISSTSRTGIARLNESGTHDTCFNPGTGVTINPTTTAGNVKCIIVVTNVLYIGGTFNYYNGTARKAHAKINGITPINAVADSGSISSAGGVVITNVLANDTFNGAAATTSVVTLYQIYSANPGIALNETNGQVTVAAGTPPGTYTLAYQICQIGSNYCICDDVGDTITVLPSINAVNDTFTITQGTPINFNAYANDTYNGAAITSSTPIAYTSVSSSPGLPLSINFNSTTGIISVLASAPAGVYTITYTICAPTATNCDTATATLTILGTLVANDDNYSSVCLNGITGGSGGDVTANDTYGGQPLNDNLVTITLINDGGLQGVAISPTGVISIPANTPFGVYVLDYSVCYNGTTTCDTATVNICINNGINPGTGANNQVFGVAIQPDGYIIIGGAFTLYNNIPRNRIARLKPDLSLDETFDPGAAGFNNVVYDVALQNNKIIVGGRFTATTTGIPAKCLARLNANGSLDTSFANSNFQMSPEYPEAIPQVNCLGFQSNGMIIAGGNFDIINSSSGLTKAKLARFSANGVSDNSFTSIVTGNTGIVRDLYVLPDNTILAGGTFLKINNVSSILYKVGPTGNLDTGFNIAQQIQLDAYEAVNAIERTNGKMLVGGYFRFYDGTGPKNIAQISTTGVIDPLSVFNPQLSVDGTIAALAVDTSTFKIYAAGDFQSFNGNSATRIVRLFSNGSYDGSFATGTGFTTNGSTYGVVNVLKQQPDSRLIVGGFFTLYNGNQARYITRLVTTTTPVVQGRLMAPGTDSHGITLYPNPSNGVFNVDLSGYDENTTFDVTVHNPLGQLIYKGSITAQGSNAIDLTGHETGNYFITLQNNLETINKVITVKK